MSLDRLADKFRPDPGQVVRKAQVVRWVASVPGVSPTLVTVLLDGVGDEVPGVGTIRGYAPQTNEWVWVLTQPGFWVILGGIG